MKKCSKCGQQYNDPNLRFCPEDGNVLTEVFDNAANSSNDPPPTVFSVGANQAGHPPFNPPSNPSSNPFNQSQQSGGGGNPFGSSTPPPRNDNAQSNYNNPPQFGSFGNGGNNFGGNFGNNVGYNNPPTQPKSKLPLIIGGVALLLILGGGAILAIAAFVYFKTDPTPKPTPINYGDNRNNPPRTPPPSTPPPSTPPTTGKTFDSLRQSQLGTFRLERTERTNYMKIYPNLEEESLTYSNSAGKKVFVTKTRFPSRTEAERVIRDMIQKAKDGGSQFTNTTTCYSNDGRDVGLTAVRIADKGGAKSYTIYYSQDTVVTFMFNLENEKTTVDEVFKNSEY